MRVTNAKPVLEVEQHAIHPVLDYNGVLGAKTGEGGQSLRGQVFPVDFAIGLRSFKFEERICPFMPKGNHCGLLGILGFVA